MATKDESKLLDACCAVVRRLCEVRYNDPDEDGNPRGDDFREELKQMLLPVIGDVDQELADKLKRDCDG